MSKHTPGPWEVEANGVTVRQQKKRYAMKICRAWEIYMARSEREANARLIAAAPELLAALKALLEGCVWKDAHTFQDGTEIPAGWSTKRMPTDAALTDARAAISTAEGGA